MLIQFLREIIFCCNISMLGLSWVQDGRCEFNVTGSHPHVATRPTQQTFSDEMALSQFRICVIVRIVTASYMNATSVSSRLRIGDTGGILTMSTFVTDDAYSSPLRHVRVTIV